MHPHHPPMAPPYPSSTTAAPMMFFPLAAQEFGAAPILPPQTMNGFGYLPPTPICQPLLPMTAAYQPTYQPLVASQQPGGKRPYSSTGDSNNNSGASKYSRTSHSDYPQRGGRGGGRGGRGGGRRHDEAQPSATPGFLADGRPDLSKYLAQPVASAATTKPMTTIYSSATGLTTTLAPTPPPQPAAPVHCQKFMHNLCHLRSKDEPPSEDEDDDDSQQESKLSEKPPKVPRCQFIHDVEFRRSFLAKSHYTHTKFTQTHKDAQTNATAQKGSSGRHGKGGRNNPPSTSPTNDSDSMLTAGGDGRLNGLKRPVTESALLRKLLSTETRTESSRLLQAIRYLIAQDFFQKERDERKHRQQAAEEAYRLQKLQEKEEEMKAASAATENDHDL